MSELPIGTITFLFTDVQDSTRLWESHPEAMQRALKRHDKIIEDLTRENGGNIVRPRGEGDSRFLVFERALDGIRAAAAIQHTLHAEDWPEDLNLRVRMGVHTGEGEFRDGDYYGSAVNRCARLRDLASGGQTLISQSTYELVQDHLLEDIQLLDLGKRPLKGLVRSENLYQLLAPDIPQETPFQSQARKKTTAPPSLPPFLREDSPRSRVAAEKSIFVGREEEITRLEGYIEQAANGQGQITFITGEAGCGKTTLIQEFARRALDANPDLLVAYGESNAQSGIGDPYLPFRETLDMLAGGVESAWSTGKLSTEGATRLWSSMPHMVQTVIEVGPDLVDMLLPASALQARAAAADGAPWTTQLEAFLERKALYQASSSVKQLDLFEQVTRVLRELAEHNPLLLIFDDFQWADEASISLLFHLARRIADRPILLLCAYRPDEVALGRDGDRHPLDQVVNELKRTHGELTIDLGSDTSADGMAFIDAYLDSEPNRLGEDFRHSLFEHTGGHPLFTVELLRAMQDRGDLIQDDDGKWIQGEALDWDRLPARVEAVIEERIARLNEEIRSLLSVASVEGEKFTAQVVARVQNMEERRLLRELSQELGKRHRLIREVGEVEAGRHILSKYQFAHHLFQRYLYNGLSAAERRLLHGEITNALEDIFGEETDRVAVQLAYHSQRAHMSEKAVRYLRMAGDQARVAYANQEAIRYYSELLDLLPDGDETHFEVLSSRANVHGMMGHRRDQLQDAKEMLTIAKNLEDKSRQVDALLMMADAYLGSEHILAEDSLQKALGLARELDDPFREAQALRALGWGAWLRNDYSKSRDYLDQAASLFSKTEQPKEAARCLHILSLAQNTLYNFEAAMASAREALELSRKIEDPRLEATSLRRLAIAQLYQEQFQEALPNAEKALALHREVGDWSEEAHALNAVGLIYGYTGRHKEQEAALRESLRKGHELGSTTAIQFAARNLASTHYWYFGQYEATVHFVDEEIEKAMTMEDDWLVGVLHTRKGNFLYHLGQYKAALKAQEVALNLLESLEMTGQVYTNTLATIGLLHAKLGNPGLSKEFLDRSRKYARALGNPADQAESIVIRAMTALHLGEPEEIEQAQGELEDSIELILKSVEYNLIEQALDISIRIALRQDKLERANDYAKKLAELLDLAPELLAPQEYAYTIYQVLEARGQHQEAEDYLKRAYDWIQLVAEQMENEDWRRTWLEEAGRNTEILHAAHKQGIA